MRVMQVLHQGSGSGSVTSTLHLSLGLARTGIEVVLVCPPGSEIEALAHASGLIEVVPVKLEPRRGRANAALLSPVIAESRVELVNSQSSRDRTALTWLGLTGGLKVPLVLTRRQMPRTFWLENWLASRVATRVVAVSRAVGDELIRRGTPVAKLRVIHNGVVTDRIDRPVSPGEIDSWKERTLWDPERRTIGIVSRLKDQAVVLQALAEVATPVRLVLAGIEPGQSLLNLAAKVPARHAVSFIPFAPDVLPLYQLLEVVLLPTRMEGLSQALLEAMALGKPVIASAASGNLDVVNSGVDGLLVPPMDSLAWARAIEDLLQHPERAAQLGARARSTARDTFSLDRTIASTRSLYQEILNR
jgi:glycosyltransferase involved in cell wall biosynthesis